MSVEHCSSEELVTANSTSLVSVCVHALMSPDWNLSLNTMDVFGSGVGIGLGVGIGVVVGVGGLGCCCWFGVWCGCGGWCWCFGSVGRCCWSIVGAGVVFGVGLGVVVGLDGWFSGWCSSWCWVGVAVGSGFVLLFVDSKPMFDMTAAKPIATIRITMMPIARSFSFLLPFFVLPKK